MRGARAASARRAGPASGGDVAHLRGFDVPALRLASQHLTTPHRGSAEEVVRTLGAVQAQDYAGAKWALGQRTLGLTDADVERELDQGRILRTHVLRPTWHFVAAEDIRWLLDLTAPRVSAALTYYNRVLELTDALFWRSNAAIAKALSGGRQLTRSELRTVLERAGIRVGSGQRLAHLVMQAELEGVVCSGARRGKQLTYALLDERVPPAPALDRDEALLELTRRYFTSRGPATVRDFAWWSGLTVADAKRGVEVAGEELESVRIDDAPAWLTASTPPPPAGASTAHLLPNYDEYFIAYRDRSGVCRRVEEAGLPRPRLEYAEHLAILDGQLVGAWKRRIEKKRVLVDVAPYTRLAATEKRRLESAARRLGDFLELAAEVRVREPARGR